MIQRIDPVQQQHVPKIWYIDREHRLQYNVNRSDREGSGRLWRALVVSARLAQTMGWWKGTAMPSPLRRTARCGWAQRTASRASVRRQSRWQAPSGLLLLGATSVHVYVRLPLRPQQRLYFIPLPHGHGSLRPTGLGGGPGFRLSAASTGSASARSDSQPASLPVASRSLS